MSRLQFTILSIGILSVVMVPLASLAAVNPAEEAASAAEVPEFQGNRGPAVDPVSADLKGSETPTGENATDYFSALEAQTELSETSPVSFQANQPERIPLPEADPLKSQGSSTPSSDSSDR